MQPQMKSFLKQQNINSFKKKNTELKKSSFFPVTSWGLEIKTTKCGF